MMEKMGLNKSPGIDGIPLEFYIAYWDIIKVELCEIFNTVISSLRLEDRQNMGVISLIYKGGAEDYLSSWRPISLLCVDTKILAKIFAERLKTPIIKVIHKDQYCAPNKTIIDVNNNIRDLIYYSNEENIPGAIINLDWSKAFDKVNVEFLWQVMLKMGFSRDFIKIIKIFYMSRSSKCLVNGFLTEEFFIKRGVRQGCPLSMLLFIISQEPLYSALENSTVIRPIRTPNCDIKIQGYADDTNIFVANDQSIIEALNLVKKFEKATGASLNINKTKVFGIGQWKGRTSWPISNVQVQTDHMSVLGIKFFNNFDKATDMCWTEVINRISNKIRSMHNRKLTLFQRSIVVNTLLTSQIWYHAQTYPMSLKWAKSINSILFRFIWITKVEPISRNTITMDRELGGLSMINIMTKAESIFACRMLRQFLIDVNQLSLISFFNAVRVNPMVNIRTLPRNVSYTSTSYYNKGIITIRKCLKINSFPNISSKIIYGHLLDIQPPRIQDKYPLYNWKYIWKNLHFKYIPVNSREILFKYLHEILPNKHRLKQIRRSRDDLCESCEIPETNIHMVYQCTSIVRPKRFLCNLLTHCCVGEINLLKFMFLDISKRDRKLKNTVIILTALYISSIWYGRKNKGQILNIYISVLLNHLKILKKILGDSMENVFASELSELSLETVHNYR